MSPSSFAPAPPPQRSRWWLWALLGCGAILLLALVLIVGGTALYLVTRDSGDRAGTSTSSGPTSTSSPSAGSGSEGSRGDPIPQNTAVALPATDGGTLDVSVGDVSWDATQAMAELNPYSDPPPAGQVYILVPVTVTYHGDEAFTPFVDLGITYVSADGTEYDPAPIATPNSPIGLEDQPDGATVTLDDAFVVPADAVGSGSLKVKVNFSLEDETWFALS